jgi:hypothetical protein
MVAMVAGIEISLVMSGFSEDPITISHPQRKVP